METVDWATRARLNNRWKNICKANTMEITPEPTGAEKQTVEQIISSRAQIQSELAKVIVGQKEVIEQLLIALFAGGHCLITGAPGLAKTLLVKSLAQIFHLK